MLLTKIDKWCRKFVFLIAGCGSVSSENCTYFEVNGANSGDCNARICKCSSDICQVYTANAFQVDTYVPSFLNPSSKPLDASRLH